MRSKEACNSISVNAFHRDAAISLRQRALTYGPGSVLAAKEAIGNALFAGLTRAGVN